MMTCSCGNVLTVARFIVRDNADLPIEDRQPILCVECGTDLSEEAEREYASTN